MKKKNKKEKEEIKELSESMKLFIMLSGYFLLVLILFTIFQILNMNHCLGLIQVLSIITPVVIYLLKNKGLKAKQSIITIAIYLLLVVVSPFIYNKTYDMTVDGNSYHKTAIAFIKNGWNPLYQTAREFQKNNSNIVKIDKDSRVDLWIEHYPKATWIIAASIYSMTGNIESGKCMTLIFSIMLMLISFNCLRKIIDKKWAGFIALLLALNPITLAQLFSYYVDGLMGIFFAIEIFLLFIINPKEKTVLWQWLALTAIAAIFVNLKFTGLLCSGVIAAVFYFYWLIVNRKEKDFLEIFKRTTINFIIVFVTAVFIVGSNSYIKNTVEHVNPLYPLIGKDKVDIITTMQPKSFSDKNGVEKFVISLFSRTENVGYGEKEPYLKLPIKVYRSEIGELFAPDVRMSGFGPLFALILIISVIFIIYNLIIMIKHEKENLKYLYLPFLAIIITMILVGESWWARYIPQLYLVPIGSIALGVYTTKYRKNKLHKLAILGILGVIGLNICCFAYINFKNIIIFRDTERDLKEMQQVKDLKLKIGANDLYGYYYVLKDRGINYTVVDEVKDPRFKCNWRYEVENYEEISKTN